MPKRGADYNWRLRVVESKEDMSIFQRRCIFCHSEDRVEGVDAEVHVIGGKMRDTLYMCWGCRHAVTRLNVRKPEESE